MSNLSTELVSETIKKRIKLLKHSPITEDNGMVEMDEKKYGQ